MQNLVAGKVSKVYFIEYILDASERDSPKIMDLVKYETKIYNNFNLVQSTKKFPVDDQVGNAKA